VEIADEATWIRQAQKGDRQAFAELVKAYWGRVFRWLEGVSGCAHAAEDVTQEVFIKVWQALPTYAETGSFRAWVFRIARNSLTDSRRGKGARHPQSLPGDLSTKDPEPLSQLMTEEYEAAVHKACQSLPETVRPAFLLWVQEEMSYEEIAHALEITEVTARWRVYRARHLLMRMLTIQRDPN
jgi:RNA polymerase sigma-70 factor (ECF subfamily)